MFRINLLYIKSINFSASQILTTLIKIIQLAVISFSLDSSTLVYAQSAPDCKSFFPEFRDIDALNAQPGTLSKSQFEQKIVQISDQFSKLAPDANKCKLMKPKLDEFEKQMITFNDMQQKLKDQQANAEILMANALNLRDKGIAKSGDFVTLYCYGASKRTEAIYEQQQNFYIMKIGEFMNLQIKQYCSR